MCKQWFDFAIRKCCEAPQGFIYLQADPETSYERIKQRARAEATMPFEYIQQIHNRHEEFLVHKKECSLLY